MRIRRARKAEVEWVAAVDAQAFPGCTLDYAAHEWWVADDGGALVGFAGLGVLDGHNRGLAYFARAWVAPRARGQQVYGRLIRAALRRAKALGVEVVTDVHRDNLPSVNALVREGFRHYEPIERWAFRDGFYLRWRAA